MSKERKAMESVFELLKKKEMSKKKKKKGGQFSDPEEVQKALDKIIKVAAVEQDLEPQTKLSAIVGAEQPEKKKKKKKKEGGSQGECLGGVMSAGGLAKLEASYRAGKISFKDLATGIISAVPLAGPLFELSSAARGQKKMSPKETIGTFTELLGEGPQKAVKEIVKAVGGAEKKPSAWIAHVKKVQKEMGIPYREALKEASKTYKKKGGAKPKILLRDVRALVDAEFPEKTAKERATAARYLWNKSKEGGVVAFT